MKKSKVALKGVMWKCPKYDYSKGSGSVLERFQNEVWIIQY